MKRENHTVSEVARLAKVTVRTLHHYDEVGLLVPSGRTEAGYRLYSRADLERLQQILLFRALGLPLEAIRGLLDEPAADRKAALLTQRALLLEQLRRNEATLRAIDDALRTLEGEGEKAMESKDLFENLPGPYAEEAEQRWGHTDAWKESTRRAKGYTREDWARFKAEGEALGAELQRVRAAGHPPDSAAAMDVADAMRRQIDRWFYPCDRAMHERLAELYETDERFAATYEKMGAGTTAFLVAAIRANARRPSS